MCNIKYFKGWDKKNTGKDFEQILIDNFDSDNQKLYTQYGAHQADIIIEVIKLKQKIFYLVGSKK